MSCQSGEPLAGRRGSIPSIVLVMFLFTLLTFSSADYSEFPIGNSSVLRIYLRCECSVESLATASETRHRVMNILAVVCSVRCPGTFREGLKETTTYLRLAGVAAEIHSGYLPSMG
jgi:hypothetical protein